MKILYAIQGTGNGHISRAKEIIPYLRKYAEVDILVSGKQTDLDLDEYVKYRLHGFAFVFGKKGGVDHWKTFKQLHFFELLEDIHNLPFDQYDLVVNDFEPVTAWACKLRKIPIVGLSHQSAFLSFKTPRASLQFCAWHELLFQKYAPVKDYLAFHFETYDSAIRLPIIRSEIKNIKQSNLGHYTVYLPSYSDEFLVKLLTLIPDIKWEVFSKHSTKTYIKDNVWVMPIQNKRYNYSIASCNGALLGAGFEGPSEAIYLKKKLLVVPMDYQWEQQCNAVSLKKMGVPVIKRLSINSVDEIKSWINSSTIITAEFSNNTEDIVDELMKIASTVVSSDKKITKTKCL